MSYKEMVFIGIVAGVLVISYAVPESNPNYYKLPQAKKDKLKEESLKDEEFYRQIQ